MRTQLRNVVMRSAYNVQRRVVEQKLHGQVLTSGGISVLTGKPTTGTLARSINVAVAADTDTEISASIGTNLIYAKVHEYGAMINVAARSSIMGRRKGRTTKGYSINIPARPYLHPSLIEEQPAFYSALQDALAEGLNA